MFELNIDCIGAFSNDVEVSIRMDLIPDRMLVGLFELIFWMYSSKLSSVTVEEEVLSTLGRVLENIYANKKLLKTQNSCTNISAKKFKD